MTMPQTVDLAVIGAGASGCMAAAAAAESGAGRVLVLEGGDKPAAKIYATGNGRCNLTNLDQSLSHYRCRPEEAGILERVLSAWTNDDMMAWFMDRGVLLHDRDGYVYPRTDQAATVAAMLVRTAEEAGAEIRTRSEVRAVQRLTDRSAGTGPRFLVRTDREEIQAHSVLLACGGIAGPQYGCDGSGYALAASLGHTVREPLPALVPLCCQPVQGMKQAAGTRCMAGIRLLCDGQTAGEEKGEILFTDYGLSGIPVLQLSGLAARALKAGRRVSLEIDLLAGIPEPVWARERERRLDMAGHAGRRTLGDWLLGLIPDRLQAPVLGRYGLVREGRLYKVDPSRLARILDSLRAFTMEVTGTQGPARAQTTAGGVPLAEVSGELASLYVPGLFLTGELLDVDGICGGYNLRWAFAGGRAAGLAAARESRQERGQG